MAAVLLGLALLALFLGTVELGYRIGHAAVATLDDETKRLIVAIGSAILALASLLLGFSFAMANARFDSRRQVSIDEVNAIGTCYLRGALLAEPDRSELRRALSDYVDARIGAYSAGEDLERARPFEERGVAAQTRAWRTAVAAANRDPRATTSALLVQSLNEMIDLDTKRAIIFRSRVPLVVPELLLVTSGLGMLSVGYRAGLTGRRRFVVTAMLALCVAATIFVVLDLDRPFGGTIRVRQAAMMNLRERIDHAAR